MEFLVLASRFKRESERERIVMRAVIEAAETSGAERIVLRRGDVYSTGVYLNKGEVNTIVYNDWEKNWNWKKIYSHIMASMQISSFCHEEFHICLTD